MYTAFNELPGSAKIWIYQANKPLTPQEQAAIESKARDFVEQWTAHGKGLQGSATILHNQFLILGVDESGQHATGCSIDSSVHFVQALGQQLEVDFFDRAQIAFLINEQVQTFAMQSLKEAAAQEKITESTLVFNNVITQKSALNSQWLQPAGNTWVKRYFNSVKV